MVYGLVHSLVYSLSYVSHSTDCSNMCQRRQSQNLMPAKRPHTNLDENLSQKPQGLNWMISFCALGRSGLGAAPLEPVWYGFVPSSFLKTVWYSFPPSAIRGPADLQAFAPLHRCTIGPSGLGLHGDRLVQFCAFKPWRVQAPGPLAPGKNRIQVFQCWDPAGFPK